MMPSQLDLLSSCLNVFAHLVVSEPEQVCLFPPNYIMLLLLSFFLFNSSFSQDHSRFGRVP